MDSKKPVVIPGINNITVSGRIATGKSTLANHLAEILGWEVLEGGKIFRRLAEEKGFHIKEKHLVPDEFDIAFEDKTEKILKNEENHIVQSHLSGFVAQGLPNVYKILVVCNDDDGKDKLSIRIDRLMNRDQISAHEAKNEINEREEKLLLKFKKLYVKDDPDWVYWDEKYYDLIVNTYSLNQKEATNFVLEKLNINR